MCVMQRHVPCNMCQGTGCRPSTDGLISRTERIFLFVVRFIDSARTVLLSPLVVAPATTTPLGFSTSTWATVQTSKPAAADVKFSTLGLLSSEPSPPKNSLPPLFGSTMEDVSKRQANRSSVSGVNVNDVICT